MAALPKIDFSPENLKNPKYEGVFINRLNKEKALKEMSKRFEQLQFIASHNVILAAKCLVACFLPQVQERTWLTDFAHRQAQDYSQPAASAAAFVALARMSAWNAITAQYHLLKSLSTAEKTQLTPYYMHYLKFNGFEKEQRTLFTLLINLAVSLEEAENIFQVMEMQHILPTVQAYNSVMNKAENWENAQFWFVKAAQQAFGVDEISYEILIRLCDNFEQGWILLEEMIAKGFKPDVHNFNHLMALSKEVITTKILLQKMELHQLKPDAITGQLLLTICKDFDESMAMLTYLENHGFVADETHYHTLFSIAPKFKYTKWVVQEMESKGWSPTEVQYYQLFSSANRFEDAKWIIDSMKTQKIAVNENYYTILIEKCNDFKQLYELFIEMQQKGIKPTEQNYDYLLKRSPTFEKTQEIFAEIQHIGLQRTANHYEYVLKQTPNFEKAQEMLAKMQSNHFLITSSHYDYLFKWVHNFEMTYEIFLEMLHKGLQPTSTQYRKLIKSSPHFEAAKSILIQSNKMGFNLNHDYSAFFLKLAPNFQQARIWLLEWIWNNNQTISTDCYPHLFKIASSFEEAYEFILEMFDRGIEIPKGCYRWLFQLKPTVEQIEALYVTTINKGFTPHISHIIVMLQNCSNFEQAKIWIEDWVLNKGLILPKGCFANLFKLTGDFDKMRLFLNSIQANTNYELLFKHCPTIEKCTELIQEMKANNLKINNDIYLYLFVLASDFKQAYELMIELNSAPLKVHHYVSFFKAANTLPKAISMLEILESMNYDTNLFVSTKSVREKEILCNALLLKCKDEFSIKWLWQTVRARQFKLQFEVFYHLIEHFSNEMFLDLLKHVKIHFNNWEHDLLRKCIIKMSATDNDYTLLINSFIKGESNWQWKCFWKKLLKIVSNNQKVNVLQINEVTPCTVTSFSKNKKQVIVQVEGENRYCHIHTTELSWIIKDFVYEVGIGQYLENARVVQIDEVYGISLSLKDPLLKLGDIVACTVRGFSESKKHVLVQIDDQFSYSAISIKELSWVVQDIEYEVGIGQRFEQARVIKADEKYGHRLSLKPVSMPTSIQVGDIVECEVTGFSNNGTSAFTRINGVKGVGKIYFKNLPWDCKNIRAEVYLYQIFKAKVLKIDEKYGIDLSVKAVSIENISATEQKPLSAPTKSVASEADLYYNQLVIASDSSTKLQLRLLELQKNGVEPKIHHYQRLLRFAHTFEAAKQLVLATEAQGLKINELCYRALMRMTTTFDEAVEMLDQIERKGVAKETDYRYLTYLSNDPVTFERLRILMKNKGVDIEELINNRRKRSRKKRETNMPQETLDDFDENE